MAGRPTDMVDGCGRWWPPAGKNKGLGADALVHPVHKPIRALCMVVLGPVSWWIARIPIAFLHAFQPLPGFTGGRLQLAWKAEGPRRSCS